MARSLVAALPGVDSGLADPSLITAGGVVLFCVVSLATVLVVALVEHRRSVRR